MKRQSICLFRLNGVTRTMQTICTICTQTTKLVDQNVHWNIGVWVNHEMTNSSRLNGSYVVISWSIFSLSSLRDKKWAFLLSAHSRLELTCWLCGISQKKGLDNSRKTERKQNSLLIASYICGLGSSIMSIKTSKVCFPLKTSRNPNLSNQHPWNFKRSLQYVSHPDICDT